MLKITSCVYPVIIGCSISNIERKGERAKEILFYQCFLFSFYDNFLRSRSRDVPEILPHSVPLSKWLNITLGTFSIRHFPRLGYYLDIKSVAIESNRDIDCDRDQFAASIQINRIILKSWFA